MATYNNVGDTIEGLAFGGDTRRWQPKGLVKHPKLAKTMKLYSCDRNSHVEITKVKTEPEDEAIKEATKDFHRDLGDKLTADAIELYLESKGKVSTHVEEGVTARHGATLFSTKGHSVATIRTPLQNLLKKLGYTPVQQIENK